MHVSFIHPFQFLTDFLKKFRKTFNQILGFFRKFKVNFSTSLGIPKKIRTFFDISEAGIETVSKWVIFTIAKAIYHKIEL